LKRTLRSGRFTVTLDTAFDRVIEGCAAPRGDDGGTWITAEMMDAYRRLFALGHAHSVETWLEGRLVGGLYGVSVGCMFFGESMFSLANDSSKVAIVHLVRQLTRWRFELIDCQMPTTHLATLGARQIPRAEFLAHVNRLVRLPAVPSPWRLEADVLAGL
jgi:leucyl/phenylalanyl-tRNA--protein transferase